MKDHLRKINLAIIIVSTLVIISSISYFSNLTGLAGTSVCGDKVCAVGENFDNCPADCGQVVSLFVIPTYVWIVIVVLIMAVIIESGYIVTRVRHSPDERMEEYMTRQLTKGHPHPAVQSRLVRKGWEHSQVHEEFSEIKQEKLEDYLQRQLSRGVPVKDVRKTLLQVGWRLKEINQAFKSLKV